MIIHDSSAQFTSSWQINTSTNYTRALGCSLCCKFIQTFINSKGKIQTEMVEGTKTIPIQWLETWEIMIPVLSTDFSRVPYTQKFSFTNHSFY